MELTKKVNDMYQKQKRGIKKLTIASTIFLTVAGISFLYLQSKQFLNLQHDQYFNKLQAKSIFFDGSLSKRSVDNTSVKEVQELHEYMQSDAFKKLIYPEQLNLIFKKAFEMKDALDYNTIADQNNKQERIKSAIQLAAFGFSCNGYLNFLEGHSRLSKNGKNLPENESYDYLTTNTHNIIPSSITGPLAYDKKYHCFL